MAVSVPLTFLFLALVILLGFVTGRIFQTTRFPDIPLLLSLGLVVGPLNRAAETLAPQLHSEFLARTFDLATLKEMGPFFSQLALIVILFDSGLRLDVAHLAKSLRPALAHTIPTFLATVLGIYAIATFLWGMPPLVAILLGVALSNVGQTVSAFIINEIRMNQQTRSIFFVEMAIYDAVSIPILVGLLELASAGTPDLRLFGASLTAVLSVSVTFGVLGGLVWIYVLRRLEPNYPYTYMVTLATLLLVYSLNSFAGGSGAVAALVFGLVIGNRHLILRRFPRLLHLEDEGERVNSFHGEITFFIRSFFFVFLGITFATGQHDVDPVTGATVNPWTIRSDYWPFSLGNYSSSLFLLGVLAILAAIVGLRYLVVRFLSARRDPDRRILWAVYGRGLGTAVLATFPFGLAAYSDRESNYYRLLSPYEAVFINAALLIILLTVAGTAWSVMYEDGRRRRSADAPAAAPAPATDAAASASSPKAT